MNTEALHNLFRSQVRSVDFWIAKWAHLEDRTDAHPAGKVPQVRNVSMAIGKLAGMFQVLELLGGTQIPDDITSAMIKYDEVWSNL